MTNTGRFAPSPTGDFHLGNLRTAILAWAWARTTGRRFVLRIEDIDRERAGSAERQIEDLAAIGVDWDGEPLIQTERADAHEAALASLAQRGLIFECYCTRRDIREAASAPHVPPGHYPGTCLTLSESEREEKRAALAELGRAPALRLAAPSPEWTVFDELHGSYTGPVDHFVVRRADGVVLAPDYRRDLHEPVAASLPVEVDGVVITEGNYLGLELPGWADVRGLIDLLVFIDTPFEELASRLIDRHMSFGRDRADAAHWVRTVDAANMALVERTKERADLVLSL